MRYNILILLVIYILVKQTPAMAPGFFIAGCGGGKKNATATAASGGDKKVITMRFGHCTATDYAIHKAAVFFAEKVKEIQDKIAKQAGEV